MATAKEIIDSILTKCNLNASIVDNPFESNSIEVKEVIDLLNSKLSEISTERQFQQIKVSSSFLTYSEWSESNAVVLEERIQNGENKYICTTAGTTGLTEPTFTDTTTADGTAVWTFDGDANEYPLEDIAPDLDTFIYNTFFNKTNQTYLQKITDEQWQRKDAYSISEFSTYFEVRDEAIFLFPTFSSDSEILFRYYSTNWVNSTDESSQPITAEKFTKNDDTSPLPSDLLEWGTASDWLALKKSEKYPVVLERYKQQLRRRKATSQPMEKIRLDQQRIVNSNLPEGGWQV